MEIDYEKLRRNLSSLTKKGVIGIHKTGCKDKPNTTVKAITVNPYIYLKGEKVNETILGLYENSQWS